MITSVKGQAFLFLITVILGFFIGFSYDIIRVIRKIIPHSNIVIQIEDFVYWIVVALITFLIMLQKNYGEIRAFSIIGAFIGITLYFLTISHLFMKISLTIIDIIKKVIITIITIMFYPIRLVLKILSYPFNFILSKLKIIIRFSKKKYNYAKRLGKIKSRRLYKDLKIIIKKT